jgi:NAD(P)-dependent dehydrogenase (short-subunit alcohol dehydrogenase family)
MRLLVTGAGGGIGTAIVAAALARGDDVLAQELKAPTLARFDPDAGVTPIIGDLTDDRTLQALEGGARDGGIDAAILAHGIQGAGVLHELSSDHVRAILMVNAATIPRLFAALAPALRRTRGRFVAITSQAALRAEPGYSAYAAAKWAAQAWLEGQAELEGGAGVAIRTLCPGRTLTNMLKGSNEVFAAEQGMTVEDYTRESLDAVPLGRFADPTEIAAAALYLADAGARPAVLAATGGEVPH